MQKVQVKKWGNSNAIRIPLNILESLRLEDGSELEISVDKDKKTIVLTVDDGLTPYQKLMKKGESKAERKQVIWDRVEEDKGIF